MPERSSVFRNIYYGPYQPYFKKYDLFKSTKDSLDFVQSLSLWRKVAVHHGCVNTICWSESGEVLLSGSDDQHLCITSGSTFKTVTNLETAHRANIFSAKFLPNSGDRRVLLWLYRNGSFKIVSCSGDGLIIYTDLDRPEVRSRNSFSCHHGTTYKVVTIPNEPNSFMSCGEDGTVRWFDLRLKNSCSVENCREDVLLSYPKSITALSVDQVFPYQFAIGCCDSSVGIYDRRVLGTRMTDSYNKMSYQGLITKFSVPGFEGKSHRITSLTYSGDCKEVLVSYSSENLFLFNIKSFHNGSEPKLRAVYGTSSNGDVPPIKIKSPSAPPMKRLRLRGDWSDTGPNARPNVERESRDDGQSRLSFHAHLMQHVSTVLTRMLNDQPEQADLAEAGQPQNVITTGSSGMVSELGPASAGPLAPEDDNAMSVSVDRLTTDDFNPPMSTDEVGAAASPATVGTLVEISAEQPSLSLGFQLPTLGSAVSHLPELNSSDVDESEDGELLLTSLVELPGTADFDVELPTVHCTAQEQSSPVLADVGQRTTDHDNTRTTPPSLDLVLSVESGADASTTVADHGTPHPVLAGNQKQEMETSDSECQLKGSAGESETSGTEGASTSSAAADGCARVPTLHDVLEGDDGVSDDDSDSEEAVEAFTERRRRSLKTAHAQMSLPLEGPSVDQVREEEDLEEAFVRGLPQPVLCRKYSGHRNARTMIKEANFWGSDYVTSGSDCGHVFIWNRHTADLVMILEADRHVVNCVQPHPFDPVLATSGIDYDVKLWSPCAEHPNFDAARAAELTSRNEVMLEETRDTITVPASFMIRMLASFNHLRQNSPIARWRQSLQANRARARED